MTFLNRLPEGKTFHLLSKFQFKLDVEFNETESEQLFGYEYVFCRTKSTRTYEST